MADKPPYQVPTMAEIAGTPANGYSAVSTFSGCGGSSLGYRMAGFRVLWASEFVPAARDTYIANAPAYTKLDDRDIRDVAAGDILTATGLGAGEIDLLDGSPPCSAFSTAGKRHTGWGEVKKYSDTAQRVDDLFYEYARLLCGLQPRVFIAENVSGLVKGTAKGYFIRIMNKLRACGYQVKAQVLDAQWLGVPQARQRLIFIGVRNDLNAEPVFPTPLPYRYTVRDALPHILSQGDNGGFGAGRMRPADMPSPVIGASPQTGNGRYPPAHVTARAGGEGKATDPETGKDISIRRYAIGREWERLEQGTSSDTYFQLVKPDPDRACPTVTQRGGDLTVASVTHPTEARKFNLAELRAICGFPPDFVLTGTYEQRWERLGRAVPPVMMRHIAATVRDRILDPLREPTYG